MTHDGPIRTTLGLLARAVGAVASGLHFVVGLGATTLLGSRHEREARRLRPLIDEIDRIFAGLRHLSDQQLLAKTDDFRIRIGAATTALEAEGRRTVENALEDILPEAFAVVREACRRLLGTEVVGTRQRRVWEEVPNAVQSLAAIALHRGKVAEIAPGEGSVLAATLPLYLNALAGEGAHFVTTDSHLAQWYAEWTRPVYECLGLTVGVIDLHEPGSAERRAAYNADITYGTSVEFGFDYLRDNMAHTLEQRVQRRRAFAIIDEVDAILVDEGRTPLIISDRVGRDTSARFEQLNPLVEDLCTKQLRLTTELAREAEKHLANREEDHAGEKLLAVRRGTPGHAKLRELFAADPGLQTLVDRVEADYVRGKRLHEVDEMLYFAVDEKGHEVRLSDRGRDELGSGDPEAPTVPDPSADMERIVHQLLKAHVLFRKGEQYVVGEDGSIVIVDGSTGRHMVTRRWSRGLHQAVEAKEGVEVTAETRTLATITIQDYFKMYAKLAGMTGTAETEERHFREFYGMEVQVIPTNRPLVREDRDDLIFPTKGKKLAAMIDEIERLNRLGLPVLVGTTDADVSETLSRMLEGRGLEHRILDARDDEGESGIVRDAGRPGAVTVATKMLGRGADIRLGPEATEPRTLGWVKARGLDLDDVLPAHPVRAEKLELESDDDVLEAGGLQVLGAGRHDSRRIDRRLRGQSGRRGEPGASQFFLSLEDDWMRLYLGPRRIASLEGRMGAKQGGFMTGGAITKSIGRVQRRVELRNFEARKQLLDYDAVLSRQREVIYDLRLRALDGGEDLEREIREMIEHTVLATVDECAAAEHDGDRDLPLLKRRVASDYLAVVPGLPDDGDPEQGLALDVVRRMVLDAVRAQFHRKVEEFGERAEAVSRYILINAIDDKWTRHLHELEERRAAVGGRPSSGEDPLIAYVKDADRMFGALMEDVGKTVTHGFLRARLGSPGAAADQENLVDVDGRQT